MAKIKTKLKTEAASTPSGGSTRRALVTWALKRVSTAELRKLKADYLDISGLCAMNRSQNYSLKFKIERLEKDLEHWQTGHARWREEAVRLSKFKEVVETALAKASNERNADERRRKGRM
jgi:hypothetical protein